MKHRGKTNYPAIIASSLCWSIVGLFTGYLKNRFNFTSADSLTVRAFTGMFFFGVFALINSPENFKIKKPVIAGELALYGILTYSFTFCYFKSIELAGLAIACTLMFTAPFFITIISFFLYKEKIKLRKCVAILLSVAGCALVSGIMNVKENEVKTAGIIYGLLCGTGYAIYNIFSKHLQEKGSNVYQLNFYGWVTVAIISSIVTGFSPITTAFTGIKDIAICMAMGSVATAVPALLYIKALKTTDPAKATIIGSLEPVLAALTGFVAFGEIINGWQITGMALVLSAIIVLNLNKIKEKYAK